MIQEKELRIGNYIMYVGGEIGKVIGINDHGYIAISCDREFFGQSDYDPIPITPEILKKCGFEPHYDYRVWYNPKCGYRLKKYSMPDSYIFECNVLNPRFMLSLHELQNLHHAITGTELNVQL